MPTPWHGRVADHLELLPWPESASANHIDAAARGAFLSLDVARAKVLINKIASNQSWKGDRQTGSAKGVHQIDGIEMLAVKMDLLMKNQIMESWITCETCGDTGHSSNCCPMTQEDMNFIGNNDPNNSGYRPQQVWNSKPNLPFGQQQGNNFNNNFQPSLKDLVYDQKQINDNISKKFQANDKILESLSAKLEGFNSVIKNQLSFNKMIEIQVAQLASSCPNHNMRKLPGQPEVNPKESVNTMTTRTGKPTQDPPHRQDAGTRRKTVTAREADAEYEVQEEADESNTTATQGETEEVPRASREYHDTARLTIFGMEKEASGRQAIRQVRRGN
jgi:hypothetical protein